jgi:hypothetical protein
MDIELPGDPDFHVVRVDTDDLLLRRVHG